MMVGTWQGKKVAIANLNMNKSLDWSLFLVINCQMKLQKER